MTVTVKFRNKDRLFQALRKTVPAIDKELRAALEQSGEEMVAKARSFAPFDDGDLHKSIGWAFTKSTQANADKSPAILVFAGEERAKSGILGRLRLFFGLGGRRPTGTGAFYARFVEFGTPDTPRQPFFFPAYRLLRSRIRGRLSRAMTKAIKRAGF